MIKLRNIILILLVFFLRNNSIAQQASIFYSTPHCELNNQSNSASLTVLAEAENNPLINTWAIRFKDSLVSNKAKEIYPPVSKDFKKLALNTSLYFGATIIAFGVLAMFPENVSGWQKKNLTTNEMFTKWNYNVEKGPVMDHDNNFFNYATHPYCGGVYYITARSCGFKPLTCFAYSALMSTFFWEYGIEAFAEPPSMQDLIVTPVIGSLVGEGFYYTKKAIINNNRKVLRSGFLGAVSLLVLDPFNTVIDGLGYRHKVKTEIEVSPEPIKMHTGKTNLGFKLMARF